MNDVLIQTTDLVRIYRPRNRSTGGTHALRGINLSIRSGDFVSVTGPSGAGKTTLFNLLGLLDKPDHGTILFRDTDVGRLGSDERAVFRNRSIGFVFQHFLLIPNLTAFENALTPVLLSSARSTSASKDRMRKLFNRLDIDSCRNRLPAELSGGERQRVAIARSLANDPEIILADEPTGSVDSQSAANILDMLVELNLGEGKTVLVITHSAAVASRAGRTIQLRDGKVVNEQKDETECSNQHGGGSQAGRDGGSE